MKLEGVKHGLSSFLDSIAEGWQHLRQSASGALTDFKPGSGTNLPSKSIVDDVSFMPGQGWSMIGGDLFEDEQRIVVKLEVPGMDKNDLDIEVQGNALVVRGEKRFEKEETEGRYRVLQCAYGSFQRMVPLPVAVMADKARASYRNGVLRIELPKAETGQPRKLSVKVD